MSAQPKLLSARNRISTALMQAKLQQNKPSDDDSNVGESNRKQGKKKGAVGALLAARGRF